jgi:hypothetical protein
MSQRPLTLAERCLLRLMDAVGPRTTGYTVVFMEEVLRQQGILGCVRWSRLALRTFKVLERHYGKRDVYLVAGLASFWNGCTYCSYGELYAFNLEWFKEKGTLFPISEQDMVDLQSLPDDKGVATLRARLAGPEFADQLRIVDELFAARQRTDLPEDDPRALALHLYDFVNECSILYEAPAPPLSAIAKKRKLIGRYNAARAAAASG